MSNIDGYKWTSWLESLGIKISKKLSKGDLEACLQDLSINTEIPPFNALCFLNSLRLPEHQSKVIEKYKKEQTHTYKSEDDYPALSWIYSRLILEIERRPEFAPLKNRSESLAKTEEFFLQAIRHELKYPIRVNSTGAIEANTPWMEDYRKLFDEFLIVAMAAQECGCFTAATVICSCLYRLYRQEVISPPDIGIVDAIWGTSLLGLELPETAFYFLGESDQKILSQPFSNPGDAALKLHHLLALSSIARSVEIPDRADAILVAISELIEHLYESAEPIFQGTYAIYQSLLMMKFASEGNAALAFEHAEAAYRISEKSYIDAPDEFAKYFINITNSVYVVALQFKASEELYHLISDNPYKDIKPPPLPDYRFDLQHDLARLRLESLSLYLQTNSRPPYSDSDIRNEFINTERFYKSFGIDYSSSSAMEMATLYGNWGHFEFSEGNFGRAIEHTLRSIRIHKDKLDLSLDSIQLNLGGLHCNLINYHKRLGKYEEALQSAENAFLHYALVKDSKFRERLASVFTSRALVYIETNRKDKAANDLTEAESVLDSTEFANRIGLDTDRFRLYFASISLMGRGLDSDWYIRTAQRAASIMDHADWFSPTFDVYFGMYIQLGLGYIRTALHRSPNALPELAGIIFCRTLTLRYENAIQQSEAIQNVFAPDKARVELWHKRETLKDDFEGFSDVSTNELLQPTLPDTSERVSQSVGERMFINYLDFRDKVKSHRRDPRKLLSIANKESYFSTHALASKLEDNECLVLLFDFLLPTYVEHVGGPFDESYAWILTAGHNPKVIGLQIDHSNLKSFLDNTANEFSGARRNGGYNIEKQGKEDKYSTFEDLEDHLRIDFWREILKSLPHTTSKISLVTQGRFHLYPWDLSRPDNIRVSHFPSLLFFTNRTSSTHPSPSIENPGLLIDNPDKSLPFASRETSLIKAVNKNTIVKSAFSAPGGQALSDIDHPVSYVHFSGHGDISRDRRTKSTCGLLILGNDIRLSEEEIISSFPPSHHIWLGACVIGSTHDDREGDPTGIVIPLLLKGARYVVGCSTVVPDLWMPLVAALTEFIRLTNHVELHEALASAKQVLRNWDSDPQLSELVVIYKAWLTETWKGIILSSLGVDSSHQIHPAINPELEIPKHALRAAKNLGVEIDRKELANLSILRRHDNEAILETVSSILASRCITPPENVCMLLTCSVRAYCA